ncbi:type VII toxin-antitoxin system MntA family adenylyltransferase antitoxin [Methanosarcina horonobensis]|uniref:type VII toxin-antitoxin system MntA family adenylyltransferase antitoxin n=1 Tax=Methanosarcina horonobensis TaxID=418008 RepID=UPI000AC5CF76|nr:nucleotidyltransferase domain-containing protein [Methanosarcina horonobensis]
MIPEIYKLEKETLISRLAEFFRSQEHVELAYLFGSTAEDHMGPLSDIDVGIYLSIRLTKRERIEKRLELTAELASLLKTDRIDLVVMNDAFTVINFEIIKPNIPVFVRDEDFKIGVEQEIMSRYLDRKYHENLLNKVFFRKNSR